MPCSFVIHKMFPPVGCCVLLLLLLCHTPQGLGNLLATYLPEYGNLISSHSHASGAVKKA